MGGFVGGLFLIIVIFLIVRACSSSDNSDNFEYSDYEIGYEDGWIEVCEDVRQISSSVYQELRNRRTC